MSTQSDTKHDNVCREKSKDKNMIKNFFCTYRGENSINQ